MAKTITQTERKAKDILAKSLATGLIFVMPAVVAALLGVSDPASKMALLVVFWIAVTVAVLRPRKSAIGALAYAPAVLFAAAGFVLVAEAYAIVTTGWIVVILALRVMS